MSMRSFVQNPLSTLNTEEIFHRNSEINNFLKIFVLFPRYYMHNNNNEVLQESMYDASRMANSSEFHTSMFVGESWF